MYVEQEMYYVDSDILEIILLQKNMSADDQFWNLGPWLFRVVSLYGFQI